MTPVKAQQPTQVNPTAQSVKEKELLKELQRIQGRGTLPDTRARVLEQPEGRAWRQFHQVTLRWIGAIAILGVLILLVGGVMIGFGSRYAGGCTSGHAISGLSNLQLPSLIAVVGFFIGGLLMTHMLMPLIF